jgi:hypothetical protein
MGDHDGEGPVRSDTDAIGARPYQTRPLRAVSPSPTTSANEEAGVRPYLLTGGRTRSANALIGFETMVTLTAIGQANRVLEHNERRAILDRCDRPISVVELSAYVRVPLGVAQVLAGDLADCGYLQVHAAPTAPSKDKALLERLSRAIQKKQAEVA